MNMKKKILFAASSPPRPRCRARIACGVRRSLVKVKTKSNLGSAACQPTGGRERPPGPWLAPVPLACPSLLPRRPSFPGCSSSTALMSGRLASPSVDGTQMHHICLCTALQYARMDAIIDEFNQKLTRLSSHACRTVRMPPNLQLTCLLPFSLVLVSPYTTCFLSLPLSLSPLLSSLPSRPLFPFRSLYFFSLALSRLAETQINNVSAIRGEGVKTKQKDK